LGVEAVARVGDCAAAARVSVEANRTCGPRRLKLLNATVLFGAEAQIGRSISRSTACG
jgi:hypothetical protein